MTIKAAITVAALAASLSACSTTKIRREDAPTFTGTSTKSLAALQGCLATAFEGNDSQPAYLPKENGGTYTQRIGLMQNYVAWTLDVIDTGDARKVTLFAVDSIGGKNKNLIAKVEGCL